MPIFRIKNQAFKAWFYRTPLWIRNIVYVFVCPYWPPITREQEIFWDYLAAKHNHK